jgi:hypothetical protein
MSDNTDCPCGAEKSKGAEVCQDCWGAAPGDLQRSFYRERARSSRGNGETAAFGEVKARLREIAEGRAE